MRFKGLDLNLLVALDALLADKNVSLAARRVFRSQSAMSGALARLREHFQDELLVPLGRKLVLTAFAESIVGPVHALMAQIDQTLDVGGRFNAKVSNRHFTLAVSDYLIEQVMPSVVDRVSREAPNVVLEFVATANGVAERIENGQVDMLVGSERVASNMFYAETLMEEDYVVVGWIGNNRLHEDLSGDELLMMGRVAVRFGTNKVLSYAETQMLEYSPSPNIEVYVPFHIALPRFLLNTDRVALIPRSLARLYAQILPLKAADLPIELRPLRLVIQHHSARSGDVGFEWLKTIIRGAVDETYKSINQ